MRLEAIPAQQIGALVTEASCASRLSSPWRDVPSLEPTLGPAAEAPLDRPDRFDIERNAPRTLSFCHGIRLCVGQQTDQLRRQEMESVQGWGSMPVVFGR